MDMKKIRDFIFDIGSMSGKFSVLLLVSRVIFGTLLASHGLQKLNSFGALSKSFLDPLGIGSELSLSLAIFGELICSIAFILGFLYRLVSIPMMFTMLVAFVWVHKGSVSDGELAFVYLVMFFLMFLAGAGKYSIDRLFFCKCRK